MSRLTLRLPDTLHRQLEALANSEQISLNQYIVYALTRQATQAYTVQSLPEKALAEQRATYAALLERLGRASFEEIEQALNEREATEAEIGLNPEAVTKLKRAIKT